MGCKEVLDENMQGYRFKLGLDCIKINYYKRMFSKVISRVSQYQQLTSLQTRAFRASTVANNKKPSIGDAVTILQSKVSGINQVVSRNFIAGERWTAIKFTLSLITAK